MIKPEEITRALNEAIETMRREHLTPAAIFGGIYERESLTREQLEDKLESAEAVACLWRTFATSLTHGMSREDVEKAINGVENDEYRAVMKECLLN